MTDEVKTQVAVLTQEVAALRKSTERLAVAVDRNSIEMAEMRGARQADAKRGTVALTAVGTIAAAVGGAVGAFVDRFNIGGGG